MSKSTDYLDFNWFVGKKIFEKTTGSSLFTDFEEIFEREVKAIEEERIEFEKSLEVTTESSMISELTER